MSYFFNLEVHMSPKDILKNTLEVVTFLFAMFGGFLVNVAPPEEADSKFAVGFASFIVLILLLLISAFSHKGIAGKRRKRWLLAAVVLLVVAVSSGIVYKGQLDQLTFPFPPGSLKAEYVAGTELTPVARDFAKSRGYDESDSAHILDGFGGLPARNQVWPPASINRAKMILRICYLIFVVTIASSIFCLLEVLFATGGNAKSPRPGG